MLALLLALPAQAAEPPVVPAAVPLVAPGLEGRWIVDLRLRFTDAPYSKPMVLTIAADGTVSGEFYDHEIESGKARTLKGRTCFAFRTSDQSGPYQTSGCLVGSQIDGQSWSEGRKFVLPWTATRP